MKIKHFINLFIFSNLSVQTINLLCIITVLSIIYSKNIINWEGVIPIWRLNISRDIR